MPRLGNDRNELYAKHRARKMIPSKAAVAAGYSPNSSTTHLEDDPEIQARIEELRLEYDSIKEQQTIAAREAAKVVGQLAGFGRSWVLQQLAETAGLAKNDGEYKDAINALELIGKDFGMFKGGSEDEGSTVPKTTDLDALAALVNTAHEGLPAEIDTNAVEMPPLSDAEAAELVAGQKRAESVQKNVLDALDGIPVSDDDPIDYDALRRSITYGDDDEDLNDEASPEGEEE